MSSPDPGNVLRRALVAWGWGHLVIGDSLLGRALLVAEAVALLLVAWLTVGLADSSAYLVPFLAGIGFLAVWGWQAVHAYRAAQARQPARPPTPERSPATAIGWLSIPLLAWSTGFWLIGADAATPAATLDRFVSAWTSDAVRGAGFPDGVVRAAEDAADRLGTGPDRYHDVRFSIASESDGHATAIGEAIHFERRATRLFGIFPGSELVPVGDEELLTLELEARPVELPGGGDIGAVRWELVDAD
ncbi:MAG: hypothetical protein M3Y40_08910 [Chloroflexota bacterium]|nr:hypothetical protein [Chloroflexota bacterium]